jgi:hypothetical protein
LWRPFPVLTFVCSASQAKAFNNTAATTPKKAAKNSGRWN